MVSLFESPMSVEQLRRRHLAGDPVRLADVFGVVCLTEPEQHVIRERLCGRSYGQIARDRFAGRALTRQRLQQVERVACRRLGLAASVATLVHDVERADRGREKVEQSRGIIPTDLHTDGPACSRRRKVNKREAIQTALESLADRWLKDGGSLALTAEADRLSAALARIA
jgi:hypothetical protein